MTDEMRPHPPYVNSGGDSCSQCGKLAEQCLYVHYRYPRTEVIPEPSGPYYVNGGGGRLLVCGSPVCGATAMLAKQERILFDARNPALERSQIELFIRTPEDVVYRWDEEE
jgi:hypothetical protein